MFELYNGMKIPEIGFGTWKLSNDETGTEIIKSAISNGYRLFDTAASYLNEEAIGKAIMESPVDRSELCITNKLWNSKREYKKAVKAVNKSLSRMSLEYFDIVLIHWPYYACETPSWKEQNLDTWKALVELYEEGKIKAIGVCNSEIEQLEVFLQNGSFRPMINQIEVHPGYYPRELIGYCRENGILVEAWSPLGSGAIINDPDLRSIAEKYGVTVAQLCLNWCNAINTIPISKTISKSHMVENLNALKLKISLDDVNKINQMTERYRSEMRPNQINNF